MATKKEIEENMNILKYLESQGTMAQRQIIELQRAMMEVESAKTSLETISKIDKDTAALLPLNAGVFTQGTLKKTQNVLIDIGQGIITEKTIADAKTFLESRQKDLNKNASYLQEIAKNIERQYAEQAKKLEQMVKST